jgi:demethylmenaquinone methyltransferase/2-methoxy-6-polyprenyl-1,4-benzoquinol methylase
VPDGPAPGNPVPPDEVRAMFDRIAPIYDRMNTLMTGGQDARWRRLAADATGLGPGMRALDVACGSGALTRELAARVGPDGSVVGIDASVGMLERARGMRALRAAAVPEYLLGDALALPLPDASVDAATIAFGLRNVGDYGRALAELARVTRPGGRVVVLEIATPRGAMGRVLAGLWFRRVVPLLGRVAGGRGAYRYLPDSVTGYPSPAAVAELMAGAGLIGARWRSLAVGMVTLHVGGRG